MYNPNLEPKDFYENMYIIATVLGLLEELAMEETFFQRLHILTNEAWGSLPKRFTVEFPE